MALSFRSIRNGALVAVLLGFPVLLLRGSLQDPHQLTAFDRALRRIGAPLQAALSYSAGTLGSFFERWVMQAKLQDENETLRGENRELRQNIRELSKLAQENTELRRALQMRGKVLEDMISAERIGIDQSPFFRVMNIKLDRGKVFVQPGMAVLAVDGVVGRIDKSFDEWSDVMLITDPRSRLAVEIARVRAQGILEGAAEDGCQVKISKDFEVLPGDLVQTSGVDTMFPKGQPVGQVLRVEPLVGDQQLVHVVPSVRFDRLDVVWVVLATAPPQQVAAGNAEEPSSFGLRPIP